MLLAGREGNELELAIVGYQFPEEEHDPWDSNWLLVALRVAGQALELPNGHPVLLRLRDSYLDVWRDHGSPQHLREQCDLALQVGPLQRALTWRRILRGVHADEVGEWADAVPGWTAEHLAPSTLSAAPGRG